MVMEAEEADEHKFCKEREKHLIRSSMNSGKGLKWCFMKHFQTIAFTGQFCFSPFKSLY